MLPDPLSRMQRSGAAAPLLDAVRNRDSREAVRSVIERFRGVAAPAQVPGQAPAPTSETAPALAGSSAPLESASAPAEPAAAPAQPAASAPNQAR
jgi:AsmA protein